MLNINRQLHKMQVQNRGLLMRLDIVGIENIGDNSIHIVRRFIWLVLIVAGTSFLVYHVYHRIAYFQENPINVNVDLRQPKRVPFPAITICNHNKLVKVDPQGLSLMDISEEDREMYQLQHFDEFLVDAHVNGKESGEEVTGGGLFTQAPLSAEITDSNEVNLQLNEEPMFHSGDGKLEFGSTQHAVRSTTRTPRLDLHGWNRFYQRFSHQKNDTIVCRWGAEVCQDILPDLVQDAFIGNGPSCYTVNGQGKMHVKAPGPSNGFYLGLFAEIDKYEHAKSRGEFHIYIHQPGDIMLDTLSHSLAVTIPTSSVKVAAGTMTYLSLKMSTMKFLSDECSTRQLTMFGEDNDYSTSKCLLECITNTTRELCGCRALWMPGNMSICQATKSGSGCWEKLRAALWHSNDETEDEMEASVLDTPTMAAAAKNIESTKHEEADFSGTRTSNDFLPKCDCPKECELISYEKTLNTMPTMAKHGDEESQKRAEQNEAILFIYFDTLDYLRIERQPAYSWLTLLADLGGCLGLVLGSCVLTLAQIIDYTCAQLCIIVSRRLSRKLKGRNDAFTSTLRRSLHQRSQSPQGRTDSDEEKDEPMVVTKLVRENGDLHNTSNQHCFSRVHTTHV